MGFRDKIKAASKFIDKKSKEFEKKSIAREKKTLAKLKRQSKIEQERAKIRVARNRGNVNRAGRSESPFGNLGGSSSSYDPLGFNKPERSAPKKSSSKKKSGRSITIKID